MTRYIDADALYKKLYPLDLADKRKYTINAKAVADAIVSIPTADVVPKSEVEELQTEIEELQAMVAKLRKENIELLISKETDIHISMEKLVKVRTEHPIFKAIEEKVAREIFEEFEQYLDLIGAMVGIDIRIYGYEEFKKKYTEE